MLSIVCPQQVNGTMVTNSSHLEVVKLIKCELAESQPLKTSGSRWPGGGAVDLGSPSAAAAAAARPEPRRLSRARPQLPASRSSAPCFRPGSALPVTPSERRPRPRAVHGLFLICVLFGEQNKSVVCSWERNRSDARGESRAWGFGARLAPSTCRGPGGSARGRFGGGLGLMGAPPGASPGRCGWTVAGSVRGQGDWTGRRAGLRGRGRCT